MSGHRLLVEQLDGHGNVVVREILTLAPEQESVTIGRDVESDIVLNDDYAAPRHATISIAANGSLSASDLGSINGLIVAGKRHRGTSAVPLESNTLRVGRSRVRLRSSREELASEKSDKGSWFTHPLFLAIVGGIITLAHTAYEAWVEAPKDVTADVLLALSLVAGFIAGWVAVWAFLTRVTRNEWRWLPHAAIALVVSAVSSLFFEVLGVAWFTFELPGENSIENWFLAAVIVVLLYLHFRQVADLSRRRALLFAAFIPVLTVFGMAWMSKRNSAQDVNAIDAQVRIYPPALRIINSMPLDAFLAEGTKLRKQAVQKRDALPPNDNTPQAIFGF